MKVKKNFNDLNLKLDISRIFDPEDSLSEDFEEEHQ